MKFNFIIILPFLVHLCQCSCSSQNTIVSKSNSFSGYANTLTFGVTIGPISDSVYSLFYVSTPSNAVVRKVNFDDSVGWMAAIDSFYPLRKSLSVDSNEQHVYFGRSTSTLNVCRLQCNNGAIVDAQTFSSLDGQSDDIRIHVLTDDSGYFVTGKDTANKASICKYLFSTPTSSSCQKLPNLSSSSAQLYLSPSTFFLLNSDPSTYNLNIYHLTFTHLSPNWSSSMPCSSGTCTFSELNGTILSSRYKSSVSCSGVSGSAMNEEFVIASICSKNIMIFNTATEVVNIKEFSGTNLYGCTVEATSGRIVVGGYKSSNGYITKFMVQSIVAHPDFQASSISMNILPSGSEEITSSNSQTIGAVTSQTVSSATYNNKTVTYVSGTSYTSDVNFLTSSKSYSILEGISIQMTPELPCSISGATSISFSIGNYMSSVAPSWIIINSATGALDVKAPEENSDNEYGLYINSNINGVTEPVQKYIKVIILNCAVSNCQKCINANHLVCEICNSGFFLNSGTCTSNSDSPQNSSKSQSQSDGSETAKILSTTNISVVITIIYCVILATLFNASSMASIWLIINQLQIFFLLLLTRAFIPNDIVVIITKSKFASNIYEYIFDKLNIHTGFFHKFEFELRNHKLEQFEIKYSSTLANSDSILVCLIIILILHMCLWLLRWIFSKCKDCKKCVCFIKIIQIITEKVFNIMTFGFYITNFLELSQFILISSISEINEIDISDSLRIISFVFAVLMILCNITLLIIINYLTFSRYELIENKNNKLGEFIYNLQENKKSRFYLTMLLVRKLSFVAFLITLVSVSSRILIGIMISIQLVYGVYIIFVRP